MGKCEIIDLFPFFMDFWIKNRQKPIEDQIRLWAYEYMAPHQHLLAKLQNAYLEDGYKWEDVASENVFPHIPKRIEAMKTIHQNLIPVIEPLFNSANTLFNLQFDVCFVIYVGIGVGAGWATEYMGVPAVLAGLENTAECGWVTSESLKGLMAHELGHIIHHQWRKSKSLPVKYDSPYWSLYEEGIAMRFEHFIIGYESFHEQNGQIDWVNWCRHNLSKLSGQFLDDEKNPEKIKKFFGSWFDIDGMKQTGYYLGHEIIKTLEQTMKFKEICLLSMKEIESLIKETLVGFLD